MTNPHSSPPDDLASDPQDSTKESEGKTEAEILPQISETATSTLSNATTVYLPSSDLKASCNDYSASDEISASGPLPQRGPLCQRGKRIQNGRSIEMTSSEAHRRLLELRREQRAAGAELHKRSTVGLFKQTCSTDVLFLIDTTGSMTSYISAAKKQVISIMKNIKTVFLNEADVRMAVVGYKDHYDSPNIEFLDFTPSADKVHSFLNQLRATGGGDAPEDVLGGIKHALNASWKQQTRCIIHIADAPPHGRNLQVGTDLTDSFPEPGSEPHGLTYEPLLKQMVELNINYALLRITATTDTMAFNFFKIYAAGGADGTLLRGNVHYNEARTISEDSLSHCKGGLGNLVFEEAALGTNYDALKKLVVRSVTSSASRTAVRTSSSLTRNPKKATEKKLDLNLASIEEDEDDASEASLENVTPEWEIQGWLDETLLVEGFSPDIGVHNHSTLNSMMASDDHIRIGITELAIQKRSQPFAQGAVRVASYARTASSSNRFVVKSFKKSGKRLAHVAEDMQCQALCKAFALEFNALSREEQAIDFIVTTCLKGKSEKALVDRYMSLEPFIEGTYVKYNNNSGYVNSDNNDRFNKVAQAFSHFTFERSRGRLLVCDLQGVGHVLTDPAIHTLDPERFKLADTNLGPEGFKFFFSSHVCNDICTKLGLQSNASMIASGKHKFRLNWPKLNRTTCCSNKLCGRIVRMASAKKSALFPGYHWCDACWPQLKEFSANRTCSAPGPEHEFEVSEFFYESQGRKAPERCSAHRKDGLVFNTAQHGEASVPSTAVVRNGFWARLKSATKKMSCL